MSDSSIVLQSIRLVHQIARRYPVWGIDHEDLVSSLVLHLLSQLDKYDSSRSYGCWCSVVCRNYCLNERRKRWKIRTCQFETQYELASSTVDPQDSLLCKELLACLSDEEKQVLQSWVFEGLSQQEVAQQFGRNRFWTIRLYNRAIAKMRRKLDG